MLKKVPISDTALITMEKQLKALASSNFPLHLTVQKIMNDLDLSQLQEFIKQEKPFPFAKLSLQINPQMLDNPHFLDCLSRLNDVQSFSLELVFPERIADAAAVTRQLNQQIAPAVKYPIHISPADTFSLITFQSIIIANIQEKNRHFVAPLPRNPGSRRSLDADDPIAREIKLKQLIRQNKLQAENRSRYIHAEIQHVETTEQQTVYEEVAEAQIDAQEIQAYSGRLIGFDEFKEPQYSNIVREVTGSAQISDHLYNLLRTELFANLPHAIKFVSPLAAEQLAENLPALASLNKENLPHGFLLKKTQFGELVLDFDPLLEKEEVNSWTPPGTSAELSIKAVYDLQLNEEDVRAWINDPEISEMLCPQGKPYSTPGHLINLWIYHGETGVSSFFNDLRGSTSKSPGLLKFIIQNYLTHFPQWEHLYNKKCFFQSLEKMSHYDKTKLNCFKKFLENTGSSRHDLSETLTAFEMFWSSLQILCLEKKVSIEGINADWSTPNGGHPRVYMERLLFILKNARGLDDQFKGLEGLCLTNYEAYYAARYEGFKSVHRAMRFHYDPEQRDARPFNPNFSFYPVDFKSLLDKYILSKEYDIGFYPKSSKNLWLIDCENELPQPLDLNALRASGLAIPYCGNYFIPPYKLYHAEGEHLNLVCEEKPVRFSKEQIYALALRWIGMQSSGITVHSLKAQFDDFSSNYWEEISLSSELLTTLFLVSHERFKGDTPLKKLLTTLNRAVIHPEVIIQGMKLLNDLYHLDVKLNEAEGAMLFESISGMNSAEFEGLRISKTECITKLLHQLKLNKFAVFKLFEYRMKHTNPKWPFLYALDTAELLAEDPLVAAVYRDDLLLFSGLVNSSTQSHYFHARKDRNAKEKVEKVREYFHKAAEQPQPNNFEYAIKMILQARSWFSYDKFLSAFAEIDKLQSFDNQQVKSILQKYEFSLGVELPAVLTKDNADLKAIMIDLILALQQVKNAAPALRDPEYYSARSISELQQILNPLWSEVGVLLAVAGKVLFQKVLKDTVELIIKNAFASSDEERLLNTIGQKISQTPDFSEYSDFEKVNKIDNEANRLAGLFRQIAKNPFVNERQQEFAALFEKIDYSKIDYETWFVLLNLLITMPQRNFLSLLELLFIDNQLLGNKAKTLALLNHLGVLNRHCVPSQYLDAFTRLFIANPDINFDQLLTSLTGAYEKNNRDPVLELVLSQSIPYQSIIEILQFSENIIEPREKLSLLLKELISVNKLDGLLEELRAIEPETRTRVLALISWGHVLCRLPASGQKRVDYSRLVTILAQLPAEHVQSLHRLYQSSPVSADCLLNALEVYDKSQPFEQFLLAFERAPFGKRDLSAQFSISEVERVINKSKALGNGSLYRYQYRKQLMESFLFVNAIGKELPVYNNKAAKELSNKELQHCFLDLKRGAIASVSPFQKRLLALGLMREAMYRATGEFPYSTQIIALIDAMMHEGDFISNIDTGQGKSLSDSMKAALLWLDSDRVDVTTSSLVDAQRDIVNYGPFFQLLGIPCSETAISSISSTTSFQTAGVNFSTVAQLSLFFAKCKVQGLEIESEDTRVSLVVNESDDSILNNRVINRLATPDGSGISYGQEWIYYAINEFVTQSGFLDNSKTTAAEDIDNLKVYLKAKGMELKKPVRFVDKLNDYQYLSWLESALSVNFLLKENFDYVIPEGYEKKLINGVEFRSRVTKILMKDGKTSPDSVFGNGMQQLLYARLNKERNSEEFVIEPLHKTIISSNNKNFIDRYRRKKGYIWGSSGTVGSTTEVEEQTSKYGFEFGKAVPHQKQQLSWFSPRFYENEQTQFAQLMQDLTARDLNENTAPSLVFFKDIETATRFFNALQAKNPKAFPLQLYTGIGREEDFIKNAGLPGMITISTSALGRNTDIHYNKNIGLNVWHTYVDSVRGMGQKSGRTGRQGSAGEVHFYFNRSELGGKSIEAIQAELDATAAVERNVNEELYDIIGYFFSRIEALSDKQFKHGKTRFYREAWADFSSKTEFRFREIRHTSSYNKEVFLNEVLVAFQQMMGREVIESVPVVTIDGLKTHLDSRYPIRESYYVYEKPLELKECTPPVDIAYQMLQFASENENPEETRAQVKKKLALLFSNLQKNNYFELNQEYAKYLVTCKLTKEVIVEAHKEFISEFLQNHTKETSLAQRWFGFEGQLSKIACNEGYLLTFHALANISCQQETEQVRAATLSLLNEYLECSWFINASRKSWVKTIKEEINRAENTDAIVKCLSEIQIEIAEQDVATNRQAFKPLHFFGNSRLQNTISKSIQLATAVSGKPTADELIEGLSPVMAKTVDMAKDDLTIDQLKKISSSKKKDKANASVLNTCLESALAIKNRQSPGGMTGRCAFFDARRGSDNPRGASHPESPRRIPFN